MKSGVTACFRIETDCVRQCAHLRDQTAGLRAAAAAARAVNTAGARFPSSVLGGELLGLMSRQFRDLLAQPNGRRGAPYGRDPRREFDSLAATEPRDASWTGAMREKSPSAAFEPGRTGTGRAAFELNGATVGSASGATPANGVPESASPSPAWESVANGDASQFSWLGAAAPAPANQSLPAEPPGVMAKQLREYWQMERRTTASRVEAPGPPEPRAGEQRAAMTESKSAGDLLRFGQTTFAERLQSFVSGGVEPREHTARAPWREAAESAPDGPGVRTISEPTAGAALSGGFAVRLADTLRSQATQHGIDLT